MSRHLTHQGIHNLEQVSTTVSYTASGATMFMGLTVDEWGIAAAIVGMSGVVLTFAFNVWFKMKYGVK